MATLGDLVNRPVAVPEPTTFVPPGRLRSFADWARARATPAVAKRRRRLLFRGLKAASTLYLDMVANVCFDIERNGELRVLRTVAADGADCIFDVGANVGDWTAAATAVAPAARIHSFEIVSDTARLLRERVHRERMTKVTVNALGLSDERGTAQVAYLPEFPEGSSAAVVQPAGAVEIRECAVETGDDYCRDHGIEHIDFLKLDVEGLEQRVLKGFDAMLTDGRIDVIQFEYGHLNASVRFLLGDFYELFAKYEYLVGKIYPEAVDFRGYDPRDEDFRGPNFLAVQRARTDLIERLATTDAKYAR